jgi:Cu-Zn family superoxide dismutase
MMIRTLLLGLPLSLLSGCTNAVQVAPISSATMSASSWVLYRSASPSPETSYANPPYLSVSGTFLPYRPGSTAISYDPAVVPPGARATLTITRSAYGTVVRLDATGLIPNRGYGAHLHVNPCGADPEAAGGHYQNHKDPVTPSVNPVYANPSNEVWLDFTTSLTGTAASASSHGWDFNPAAPPRSLVLHAERTMTGPGVAGKAGARVACLTLPAS